MMMNFCYARRLAAILAATLLLLSPVGAYIRGVAPIDGEQDESNTETQQDSARGYMQYAPQILVPSPTETEEAAASKSPSFCHHVVKSWKSIDAATIMGESSRYRLGNGEENGGRGVVVSDENGIVAVSSQHGHHAKRVEEGVVSVYRYSVFTGMYELIGLPIFGSQVGEQAGFTVDLNKDGQVLATGAVRYHGDKGHYQGAAQVFKLVTMHYPAVWTQVGRDIIGHEAMDSFGHSVSLSGDGKRVAVGAIQYPGLPGSSQTGYVEAYILNHVTHAWMRLGQRILGHQDSDRCGHVVALNQDGNIMAVASPGWLNDRGRVDVFGLQEKDHKSVWAHLGLPLLGEREGEMFGQAIEMSEDGHTIAVGSPNSGDAIEGSVNIYHVIPDVGWRPVGDTLYGTPGSGFGSSLSLENKRLAVGAPFGGSDDAEGEVYVYDFNAVSRTWELQAEVLSTPVPNGRFGSSVAVSGDQLLVTAPFGDSEDKGSLQVFELR